jgi:hypothetical protein
VKRLPALYKQNSAPILLEQQLAGVIFPAVQNTVGTLQL